MTDRRFIPFKNASYLPFSPENLNNPFGTSPPKICIEAAENLKKFILENQQNWSHNFGFTPGKNGKVKGKMFGVLVVTTNSGSLGYLSTFSGKLDGDHYPDRFVPALFDITRKDNFLDIGMTELTKIGEKIAQLAMDNTAQNTSEILALKNKRKNKSTNLQSQLFDQYNFLNVSGKRKSLISIFEEYAQRKPAGGAGECAAPKLLNYAFENKMKPLAIAEFWWGKSTIYKDKVHGEFYPACEDKCKPILSYMLESNF
tara:strand:- start:1105 stop:1875 length:771 start_codon:yes stop_codon:yes gene_type:complete